MTANWYLNSVSVANGAEDERLLLENVDMQFKAGRITLLVGHNGAGKSTLLETMAGLRSLHSGSVMLGDQSIWQTNKKKRNAEVLMKLGISLQHSESQWFAATVREEFKFSLRPYRLTAVEIEKRICGALDKVGLQPALLERDPWTLSGGQQRRLAIACLLACEPDWLLLDEPTAGLDAEGTRRLCAVLEAHRAAGRGAVVATHDLDALLPLADVVAVVNGGIVREAAPLAAALSLAAAAPQALRAVALLRERAVLPPEVTLSTHTALVPQDARNSGEPMWLTPKELATELSSAMKHKRVNIGVLESPAYERQDDKIATISSISVGKRESVACVHDYVPIINAQESKSTGFITEQTSKLNSELKRKRNWLRSDFFDPRAIVISYMLLTAGVLVLNSLNQIGLATLIIASIAAPFWPITRSMLPVLRGFLIATIIFIFIGAISFSPFAFQWEIAEPTTVRLLKLMLIMIVGMPMLVLMTPLRLQRAIEQTFGWLSKLRIPIYSFSLLVTLVFRFIPLLMKEYGRFAKLVQARSKGVSSGTSIPISLIRFLLIPYIRSILRLAESMADALEARGYGSMTEKSTQGFKLSFTKPDTIMLSIAFASMLLLFLISVRM
ncbi:ATP-binding cassette domain-containing protein [Paenibacillus sp. GSMTC-2017]|uniref:ATP-binding cassette domain-containing protein n=1 Tax=Paenibacillus sp. GSMTC-2017 TaxID=2794350 RepID=UPI0018D9FC5C|nr:ATP-binding cassette domain-containing protein [Paenibacillus sp. GSMTC-2017]MBH5316549.1 ATP-binding cassette domain-containing protein [Paenibacillus sp. GSMTC-2017]